MRHARKGLCLGGRRDKLLARSLAVMLALVASAPPALAQQGAARTWPDRSGEPTPHLPPCTCRAERGTFAVGETICLAGRLAQCSMDQNVTSWRPLGQTCPDARAPMSPRLQVVSASSRGCFRAHRS